MKGILRPYGAYRNVELRWLKRLPSHWEIQRGKAVFQPIDVRSKTGKEPLLTVSSSKGVRYRADENVSMFQAESYVGHKLCWPGDLVINSLWAWANGLGFSPYHGIVSTAYGVYRPRESWAEAHQYFQKLLRSNTYDWELQVRSKGIWKSRLQLTDTSFLDMPIILPPVNEAHAIAKFLGWYDFKFNALIANKQRLIDLLNEQKQAIIQRAVTRGLDPNVPMKPSGVDWLGDVPAHWEVVLLGRLLCGLEQGWSPNAAEGALRVAQWSVLALSAVKKGLFFSKESKPLPLSTEVPQHLEIHVGDFLLTRSNTRSLVGDVCVVEETPSQLMLSDLIYRLHPQDQQLLPRFLMYQLLAPFGRAQIETDARGSSSTMVKISQKHIKSWNILLPSIAEQTKIVAELDIEVASIRNTVIGVKQEIDLIREYRERLIADVVTGKLDVRGVELPGEGGEATDEELEQLEDEILA